MNDDGEIRIVRLAAGDPGPELPPIALRMVEQLSMFVEVPGELTGSLFIEV